MTRVEGLGARTIGQKSKVNMTMRLALVTVDTAVLYQIFLDLEMFLVVVGQPQFRAGQYSPNQEWETALTAPRDRPWGCSVPLPRLFPQSRCRCPPVFTWKTTTHDLRFS